MTPTDALAAFLNAYEAKDIEAIDSMLAEDVRLQDWNLTAHGKNAVLAETRKNFQEADQLQIEVLQLYAGKDCAAAQLRIVVNRTVEINVVDAVRFNAYGQVCSIRAYKG